MSWYSKTYSNQYSTSRRPNSGRWNSNLVFSTNKERSDVTDWFGFYIDSVRTGPRNVGAPGRPFILRPFKSTFFEVFRPIRGWRTCLRARAQTVNNLRKNSFACVKPQSTSIISPITPMTS